MKGYIMNRESLKRHCEAMCRMYKDIPTSGTYGEHRLVLELLEQTTWIPVSDPPKESGEYLVTALSLQHERYITTRSYALHLCDVDDWDFENNEDAGWYDYDSEVGYYKLDNVLAWMPLPAPYES